MRFAGSLKGKLAITAAVAIVFTGTVVLLFGFFIARSALRGQVFESLSSAVSRSKKEILTTNEQVNAMAALVTSNPLLGADLTAYAAEDADRVALAAEMSGILARAQDAAPALCEISIVSLNGSIVVTSSRCREPVDPLLKAGQFVSALTAVTTGRPWMGFSINGGELVVTIVHGVQGPSTNDLAGFAVVNCSATGLEAELSDIAELGSTGVIQLSKVEGEGVAVLQLGGAFKAGTRESELSEVFVPDRVPDRGGDSPAILAAHGRRGETETDNAAGKKVVVAYDSIAEVDWGVVASSRSSEAFGEIDNLRNVMVLVIIVLLLGGSALAYVIARSVSRPIQELQDGVKALAAGDLSTRVTIKDGIEVTTLADEFNRMAGRLKELYDSLERKVEERTRALQEANERLKELDDLKSEFVSIASHELRSPMASMKMGVSTVLNELVGPLNDDQKQMLAVANRNIDRLTKLTSDLLDLTKIDAGQLELEYDDCDLMEIVNEVAESEAPQATHQGLELIVEGEPGPIAITCDRDRIYRVVQNLVANALKFTEKGSVTVSVARGEGGGARVCVEDTGVGVPAEAMPTIFEMFSQAHAESPSEQRGTGLGLAICKGIVEAHGGNVSAESTQGVGSKFCFTVPSSRRE